MPEVDIKINSVNFICDWNYNIKSDDMTCGLCNTVHLDNNNTKSQRNCILKVNGLVLSKCGHTAHLSCYKRKSKRTDKYGEIIYCGICTKLFEFDKNLEIPHTQKIYKL